jgi:hypothetical protein
MPCWCNVIQICDGNFQMDHAKDLIHNIMRSFLKSNFLLCTVAFTFAASPAEANLTPVQPASLVKEVGQADIYLLLGQSNMRGRAEFSESDFQFSNSRILFMPLNQEQLFYAREPLHDDGSFDLIDRSGNLGVGPGLFFAKDRVKHQDDRAIVLIPGARGGSWIALWSKGNARSSLYDDAVKRARLAKEELDAMGIPSRIAGILWLQGESDATEERFEAYQQRLDQLIEDFRADLGVEDLPFVAATIGSFIDGNSRRFTRTKEINQVLLSLPERIPHSAIVDARHLIDGHIGDNLHYNRDSQEKMGVLFSRAMLSLTQPATHAKSTAASEHSSFGY